MLARALAGVDFDRPGRQSLPFEIAASRSADGQRLPWPLLVLNGSRGPTVLLTGGVHGDEFEGPALLTELARTIDVGALRGRLIIAPAMNPPALLARQRCSPWDGGNLNRSFGAGMTNSPTGWIAQGVAQHLVPLADAVYDLHAGGTAHFIVPSVMIHPRGSAAETRPSVEAMLAFGAPASILIREREAETMFDAEVERQGCIFGCAELGSLGALTGETLEIGRRGLRNLLVHLGLIDGPPVAPLPWRWGAPRVLAALDGDAEVFAPRAGYFVPRVEIGGDVRRGARLGALVDPLRPDADAIDVVAPRDGTIYGRAAGGPLAAGDHLVTVADVVRGAADLLARMGA